MLEYVHIAALQAIGDRFVEALCQRPMNMEYVSVRQVAALTGIARRIGLHPPVFIGYKSSGVTRRRGA
jgi:hypothetical protein